jgi:hypothetical protein
MTVTRAMDISAMIERHMTETSLSDEDCGLAFPIASDSLAYTPLRSQGLKILPSGSS